MSKNHIVLHHSATWDDKTKRDYDAIKAGHIRIGDRDIGYHWLIEYVNGKIVNEVGRAETDSAAACPGKNFDAIHICLVGNFQEVAPTEEEYRAVADKCRDIMTRWPIETIKGHREWYATACPGKMFDVQYVRDLVKGGGTVVTTVDEALNVLQAKGLVKSPDYWHNASECVKYLDTLLINMANSLK